MTGPTGPEPHAFRPRAAHLRDAAAAVTTTVAVDLDAELSPAEIDQAHAYSQRSRTWLLVEYRRRCRDRGLSSLGRLFSEWQPYELAKALVLLDRTPERPWATFAAGQGSYRFE
jgi:hypothetical protein